MSTTVQLPVESDAELVVYYDDLADDCYSRSLDALAKSDEWDRRADHASDAETRNACKSHARDSFAAADRLLKESHRWTKVADDFREIT